MYVDIMKRGQDCLWNFLESTRRTGLSELNARYIFLV